MYSWSRLSSLQSRWSAVLRSDYPLMSGGRRTSFSSGSHGSFCELCRSTLTRWKRLLPVALRYARRHVATPTRPPSRFLLFGVAGFMWEGERISNEEVMRCLKQYEERVKTQQSLPPHQSSSTQTSLQHSSVKGEDHHQQTSSYLSPNSWMFSSLLSTITFGWFGSSQETHGNSDNIHNNLANIDNLQATSVGMELEGDKNGVDRSEVHEIDKAKQRQLKFVQGLAEHLNEHSEQCVSQMPLVGLRPRVPSFGSKVISRAAALKLRVLKRVIEASELEVKGQDDALPETEQNDCCGSKIADLACLEMESHAHTCVAESNLEGDWFQFKIFEMDRDLYSLTGDQSDLSYHFYPMVGLQERKSTNKIASLIEGSPLAGILQSIEQFAHSYDHVLGIDYYLDRNLAANSEHVKTRLKRVWSGIVSEVANEIQELKEAVATRTLNPSAELRTDTESHDTIGSTTEQNASSLRGGACTQEVGVATSTSIKSQVKNPPLEHRRFPPRSKGERNYNEISQLPVNSFHNFNDVHFVGDVGEGQPPVSRQLGHELLSMLRMARLKVKMEREQTGSETGSNNRTEQEVCDGGDESGESTSKSTASLEGWELLAKESTNTVYRRMYEDSGLYQYKVIGRYHDITAKDYLEVQVDHKARKTWDTYAVTLETMESDPKSECELIYWVMKYPFPLSSRDYVFVRKVWISPEEDAIVFISRAVEHPEFPAKSKFTRVDQYFSEMVIKPHSYIDELGFDYELTYLDNPQISLPSSVVNWVTTTAMPDFLTKIHQAATNRRNQSTNNLLHSS